MIRALLAGVSAAALLVTPARAQLFVGAGGVVTCINCSQEVNEVLRWAQSLTNQATQISNQIQALNWWVTNTVSLPNRLFSDLISPIYEARAFVNRASMFGENIKFMMQNLGHPSGYGGGSLSDIPVALAQENNALSYAMRQLGLVQQRADAISAACTQQYANIDSGSSIAGGIKAVTQAGNTLGATAGQCAEARALVQTAAWNAMVTAQARLAERQAVIDAASNAHLAAAINAGCASLTANGSSSWQCATTTPAAVPSPAPTS